MARLAKVSGRNMAGLWSRQGDLDQFPTTKPVAEACDGFGGENEKLVHGFSRKEKARDINNVTGFQTTFNPIFSAC